MTRYPFMPLHQITRYIPLMRDLGVSAVARSPRGFLTAYRRAGSPGRLPEHWHAKRAAFIARHLAQYKPGQVRRALALIAWAYRPKGTEFVFEKERG